jgi:4-amino-4-deoxy-L-arabinose transferase-like glycosyltransferase
MLLGGYSPFFEFGHGEMQPSGIRGLFIFSSVLHCSPLSSPQQGALHKDTIAWLKLWGIQHKWELLLVTFCAGIAAFLRVYRVADFPPGLQGDEAWMGLEARRILKEGWIGVWSATAWGQPTGPFYWTAFLFRLLGDTTAVLRTAVALLGVAAIPVFFLFVRTVYTPRAAVISTILLVFSYWHIHYSRTAYGLISVTLVESAILLFLGRGIKSGHAWAFLVAGIVTGMGIYTYRGYLFFVLLLVALWGVVVLQRPYPLKRLALHATLFALPIFLLAIPMLKFISDNYDDYAAYGRVVSIFNSPEYQKAEQPWGRSAFMAYKVGRALAIYYVPRSADITDALGSHGLLDPVTMTLFTVGLGIAVWRWRRWQYSLILGGVALGVVAVATTVEWGENRRGIAALPMVFTAAGLGADALLDLSQRLLQKLKPQWETHIKTRALYLGMATVLLFAAAWNIHLYFHTIAGAEMTRWAYLYDLTHASAYLRSQEPAPYVYFYSPRWSWHYEARRFQAPGLAGEDRSQEFGLFSLERRLEHQHVVYLIMSPYERYLEELQRRYPGGDYRELREEGRLVFAAYCLKGN